LPQVSQADVRKQIAAGRVGPLYLIVGADEAGKVALAGEFLDLVEPELRAFNLDRLYGGETTGAAVVDAARTLPMMAPRRIVMLLHGERLLEPKKDNESTARDLETFEAYVTEPVATSCLVIVATLDKRKRLAKLLLSKAAVVECTGPADVNEAARWVKDRVAQGGMSIDARASRLVAERVGPDIARLRSDVERLMLYTAGSKAITAEDVLEVVGPATTPENWGVTNAIERGAAADALRELAMAIDDGAVPYMILGQLGWFVRTKVPAGRVTAAVEAVFRTDLAIKTSAGDPRALLEKLVVELCGR